MKKEVKEEQCTDNKDIKNQAQEEQEQNNEATNVDAEVAEEEPIIDEAAKMAEEASKWQDKYTRLSAEFDNFRKRTLKEKMDLIETASEDVIKSVLVIMDDMDRAIEANKKADNIDVIRTGTELIHKKLGDLLRSKGIQEIEAIGNNLDTDLHEAIAKFPVEDEEKKGKVIDVAEKGYKLKEKVVRYAKVVVGE